MTGRKSSRFSRDTDNPATHPDFIRWVVETYKNDFNRYRVDILGMKPEPWQNEVGDALQQYRRIAVQSGHGIGKTGLCAAAIHWFLATRPRPAIVATANTEAQLSTKLWRELAKVNQNARNSSWFEWSATKFSLAADPTAFASALPWNENNPEAFAGTHEEHVLGIFDEASAIPPVIYTTFSGAMSTAGARWLLCGNPTMNTGYFYEACNGKLKWRRPGDEKQGLWYSFTVGSAESSLVTPEWIEEQKHTLGETTDEYRVRVLGLPPREAPDQFIPPSLVEAAFSRPLDDPYERWPLILGVDVARQGSDKSAIVPRRGRIVLDRIKVYDDLTLKQLAHAVAQEVIYYREEMDLKVRAIFIEGGGSVGWGVIEELWELGYDVVMPVNPGERSAEPERFANKRCEMWGYAKEWLEDGGALPKHNGLYEELISVKRKPDPAMKLRLESKDEMRRHGLKSPDVADAFALTFAAPVELEPAKKVDIYSETQTDYTRGDNDWMLI